MKFRTELEVVKESVELDYSSTVFFIGSCFSTTIYSELKERGFKYISGNPFGVLFNPVAIANALTRIIEQKKVEKEEFFENQGIFRHWDFGSQIFEKDVQTTVTKLNETIVSQHQFLKKTHVVFITLGTAWVYELIENQKIVANCHKMQASSFKKRLLKAAEIQKAIEEMVEKLHQINPSVHVVLTVSPIRHIKDGMVENQRSKSILLTAVHELVDTIKNVSYFPSYELIMDDLRDYRFYKKDLIHPNEQAIEYIWDKFKTAYFSKKTIEQITQVEKLAKSLQHRSLNQQSEKDLLFKEKLRKQEQELKRYIDFELY